MRASYFPANLTNCHAKYFQYLKKCVISSPRVTGIYKFVPVPDKPTIEELEDSSRYTRELTLPYGDIAPFVVARLRTASLPMILLWTVLLASAVMSVVFWPGLVFKLQEPRILKGLLTGTVLIPLLLVPLHEGLHLVPYRLAGARDIRIGTDLRQGIIYITAHRFVTGRRLLSCVAMTPFAIITAGLATTIVLSPVWWQWILSVALFVHTTMCAGDAAILTYTNSFNGSEVFTWDDADRLEAYFYIPGKRTDTLQQLL